MKNLIGKQTLGVQYSKHGPIIPCIYEMQKNNDIYVPLKYDELVVVTSLGEDGEEKQFGRIAWQRPYCGEVLAVSNRVSLPTKQELIGATENEKLMKTAWKFCVNTSKKLELEMKIVDVAVHCDRSKLIFYFTAPTRIDFRELVKELVKEYRTRIELRQIGVRHETQMMGALGNCGMVCCCRRYLTSFAPVTIKMAKEQNLFLNPTKISGSCGRLLCCLSYEQDAYEAFHRSCPKLGKRYLTDNGYMRVLRANMFRNTIAVLSESGVETELTLKEWKNLRPRRPESPAGEKSKTKQESQHLSYKAEPVMTCEADPQLIEEDPDLHIFDADFEENFQEKGEK